MTHHRRYDWLSSYRTTEKIEVDPFFHGSGIMADFAVYGLNGTEFSYRFFDSNGIWERHNHVTAPAQRQRNAGNQV